MNLPTDLFSYLYAINKLNSKVFGFSLLSYRTNRCCEMNKYFLLFCLSLLTFSMSPQGSNCASMEPFCAGGNSLVFASATGTFIKHSDAADFGCLFTQPNPSWFYLKTDHAGSLSFTLEQEDTNGVPIDGDFICWGPFSDVPPICGAANLNSATVVDCSYSAFATEYITIPNAQADKYYVLLITNYDGNAGQITLTQTNTADAGAGSTTCAIVCPVSLGDNLVLCKNETLTLTADFMPQGAIDATLTTVEWLHDGTLLPDTTPTLTINQTGRYTVKVYNPACGDDVITDEVLVVAGEDLFPAAMPEALSVLGSSAGPYTFDLTENNAVILNGDDPAQYAFSYYESKATAEEGSAKIAHPAAFWGADGQNIWVRLESLITGCHALYTFKLDAITYNTFLTPNGDGINDVWDIDGLRGLRDVQIVIFDRYGKLIRMMDPNSYSVFGKGWDGTLNGHALPADDYWFTVTYTNTQGRKIQHRSHIAVLR